MITSLIHPARHEVVTDITLESYRIPLLREKCEGLVTVEVTRAHEDTTNLILAGSNDDIATILGDTLGLYEFHDWMNFVEGWHE